MRRFGLMSKLGVSATALFMACAPASYAQSSGEAEATGAGRIGDVFVTARKRARSEALQVTPVSATAVTSATLDAAHAVDLIDLGRLTPGTNFQPGTGKGFNNFYIRGMGLNGTSPQDEAPVAIIKDGIYFASGIGAAATEVFDVSSVEVLRGPQGTLFGRNVTGGVVNITTADPEFEKKAKVGLGYGNYAATEAELMVNSPLVGDVLAGRLAMKFSSNDGYWFNTLKGRNKGEDRVGLLRAGLRFEPNEDFDVTLKAEWVGADGDASPVRNDLTNFRKVNTAYTPAALLAGSGYVTPSKYYAFASGDPTFETTDTYQGSGTVNWNLGGGVLSWITGYREIRQRGITDFDGTPTVIFKTGTFYNFDQTTTELRYARDAGRLSYTVGAYYFLADLKSTGQYRNTGGATQAANSTQETTSYAFFGEADFKLTDQLTATAGLRFTHEEKDMAAAPFGNEPAGFPRAGQPFCTGDFGDLGPVCRDYSLATYEDDNTSPKAGLSYKISDSHLVFGSVTRGYRSGGRPLRGVLFTSPDGAPYNAETVTAYEIGLKNDFFDDRVRLNLTIYQNEYEDLQRTVQQTVAVAPFIVQSTFNAADATVKGVEVEFIANLTENLTVNANYAYTDAEYGSFNGLTRTIPSVPLPTIDNLKFVKVPTDIANLGATYTQDAGELGTLRAKLGASYSSEYFLDEANTVGVAQEAYWLMDGSLALTSVNKDWTLTLWGKNLTGEEYAQNGAFSNSTFGRTIFLVSRPTTYGLKIEREF